MLVNTNRRECKWLTKTWENKSFFIEVLGLLVLVVGLIYAIKAYNVYDEQKKEMTNANRIQSVITFRSAESEIYKAIWSKPELMAIFADFPDGKEPNIDIAHDLVKLLCEKKTNCIEPWDNAQELLAILYEPKHENFHSKDKQSIRAAYDLAEQLLYLVADAYSAKQYNIITEQEYNTYQAYIHDVGYNPLFIAAISFGHSSGYIEKSFALELQKEMETKKLNGRNWKMLKIVYKEMTEPNWADTLSDCSYNKYLTKRNTIKNK
jgi:hypothetical protein